MQVAKNTIVEFKFGLVDENGVPVPETDTQTTAVLQGARNVIPGIEKALNGREAGDKFTVTVPPEDGYGPRREGWTRRVSKKYFLHPKRIHPGHVTQLRSAEGIRPVTVLKVGGKFIDVDLNHPHAGQTLHFDIEVMDVREATQEEIAHGHAHGAHGANH